MLSACEGQPLWSQSLSEDIKSFKDQEGNQIIYGNQFNDWSMSIMNQKCHEALSILWAIWHDMGIQYCAISFMLHP